MLMESGRLALAAMLTVLACSYTADALLARITCHCTSGDVTGQKLVHVTALPLPITCVQMHSY